MMYELPPQGKGTAEQQLVELRDYLVRMARSLDSVGSSEVVIQTAASKAVDKAQKQTAEDVKARAEALKALIIKTANEVTAYADSKVEEYNSLYVAQSDFGSYYQYIERDVEDTARGTIESYHYSNAIESAQSAADNALETAEAYHTELSGQIRKGVIFEPGSSVPTIGIAISENLQFDGTWTDPDTGTVYDKLAADSTLGIYTASGWQFWIGGQKMGWFSSQDSMLHVENLIVEDTLQLGDDWEITTTSGFGLRYVGD